MSLSPSLVATFPDGSFKPLGSQLNQSDLSLLNPSDARLGVISGTQTKVAVWPDGRYLHPLSTPSAPSDHPVVRFPGSTPDDKPTTVSPVYPPDVKDKSLWDALYVAVEGFELKAGMC